MGLGSNQGDRLMNLASSLKKILLSNEIQLINLSSVYETEPYGFSKQPWFLNMVVEIATNLNPLFLLKRIKNIEQQIGRKKTHHWGPRQIDIDILSYPNMVFKHPMLNIPHRQLHLRQFVLIPLKEIAACFVHPESKKNINQLLNECQDQAMVSWFMEGNEFLNYIT